MTAQQTAPRRNQRQTPAVRTPSIHPVPKPTPKPMVCGKAAQKLAAGEGHLFEDIAADQVAADALEISRQIDCRRDALVVKMTKIFTAIKSDLNASTAIRALATEGEGDGKEAIRLDRIIGEHDARAAYEVVHSMVAGHRLVGVHEELLTGREPEMPAGMVLPFPLDGGGL